MLKDEQIVLQLEQIKSITHSDVLAFALLESGHRKLNWYHLIGAKCARTYKVKQSATAGLTAQALRTGKPQQLSLVTNDERFCYGEAIMMTEELSHIYIWPIIVKQYNYHAVIIIGRRKGQSFEQTKINEASARIKLIDEQFNRCLT